MSTYLVGRRITPCLVRPLGKQRRHGVVEAVNNKQQRCSVAAAEVEERRLLLVG